MVSFSVGARRSLGALPQMLQYIQAKMAGRATHELSIPDDGALTRARAIIRRYAKTSPFQRSPEVVQEFKRRNTAHIDYLC